MSILAPAFVHESSYVDADVLIGAGTTIWHFCHVLSGSQIGERCRIGQNVVHWPASVDRRQREDSEQRLGV